MSAEPTTTDVPETTAFTDGVQMSAGEHSSAVWEEIAPIRARIEELAFLDELAAGTLDPRIFVDYIEQDGIYLGQYARAMALLAARAPRPEHAQFWAFASRDSVNEETAMQAQLLSDPVLAGLRSEDGSTSGTSRTPEASPTTSGYSSFVVAQCATAAYEVGVAAVLPCFWIYAHVGKVLSARAVREGNPFAAWLAMYDSPEFDASVVDAIRIYEECAAAATPEVRARMCATFVTAAKWEWHFWTSAHRREAWLA